MLRKEQQNFDFLLSGAVSYSTAEEKEFTVKSGVPLRATLQYCHAILQY